MSNFPTIQPMRTPRSSSLFNIGTVFNSLPHTCPIQTGVDTRIISESLESCRNGESVSDSKDDFHPLAVSDDLREVNTCFDLPYHMWIEERKFPNGMWSTS